MSRRTNQYNYVQYQELEEENENLTDLRFNVEETQKIPVKGICLAFVLFLGGVFLLVVGLIIAPAHLESDVLRKWSLIVTGALMFIPGAYHIRIAYYAYRGYPGYSFDDIPQIE